MKKARTIRDGDLYWRILQKDTGGSADIVKLHNS